MKKTFVSGNRERVADHSLKTNVKLTGGEGKSRHLTNAKVLCCRAEGESSRNGKKGKRKLDRGKKNYSGRWSQHRKIRIT